MGTDMHGPIIEVGIKWTRPGMKTNEKVDWWRQLVHYSWSERNYLFFNVLAGVRDGGYNVISPRGLPDGCYTVLDPDQDGDNKEGVWLGDHSFTWITPEEWEHVVIAYRAAVAHENTVHAGNSGYAPESKDINFVDHLLKMVKNEKDVRLIFGFDS